MQWKLCMWVGWKVCRLTMMQWSNLSKCGLFLNIVSPAGHTLLPLVLQCLDSCGIEAIMILKKVLNCSLQIWPHHQSDTASQPSVFSCWEIENSQMVPNQENMEGDNQFKATVVHSSHCNYRLVCRSIVLVKQDSLCQFSRLFWNVSSTTFQSPELLIQYGFISGRKQSS